MAKITSPAIEDLERLVIEKGSKKAAAESLGIHPSYLGEILNGTRDLSESVLEKLGYEKVTVHVKTDAVASALAAIEAALKEAARQPSPTKEKNLNRRKSDRRAAQAVAA
jgi:hypothetical protein